MDEGLFLGLDVGTQGARAVACDRGGHVVAEASAPFERGVVSRRGTRHEQNAQAWWSASVRCLREVARAAQEAGYRREALARIAVTSTSGTVLLLGRSGRPLRPAIMYNDGRAARQAERLNEVARLTIERLGYRFSASFALPKILWLAEREPKKLASAARIAHAADFLVGCLTGQFDVSDTSNVLKTGYDLLEGRWPAYVSRELGIPLGKLPRIVRPGEPIGRITIAAADRIGISRVALVVAGATDGTAAFLASGACRPGQWCSTIGTTLVLRGVSPELVKDPLGRVYCHAHPEGHWLPGAASNVGGECLEAHFKRQEFPKLDTQVFDHIPNRVVMYPLVRRGERFPFVDPEAEGFIRRKPKGRARLYAACLEAVAFTERWGLEIMEDLGAPVEGPIFASGGAVASDAWLQLRADVLDRPIRVAAGAHSAKGAAILAAASVVGSVSKAVEQMVHFERTFEPRQGLRSYFDDKYGEFRRACARKYPAAR